MRDPRRVINIYAFSDCRSYLREVLERQKAMGQRARLRTLAEQAGLKSPSLLSMVMKGKRNLSPRVAEKLATALSLRGNRRQYFLALARHQSAGSHDERQQAKEKVIAIRSRARRASLELRQYRFLGTWFYPAIYVMAGTKGMRWNAEWIAKRLRNDVTPEQVRHAIDDMKRLGLLREENGQLVRVAQRIATTEDVRNIAVYRYHKQMGALADAALALPLEEREMNGLTVAIPRKILPQIKERIRELRRQLHEEIGRFESVGEEVYQINLQLFPLTRPMEETPHRESRSPEERGEREDEDR